MKEIFGLARGLEDLHFNEIDERTCGEPSRVECGEVWRLLRGVAVKVANVVDGVPGGVSMEII